MPSASIFVVAAERSLPTRHLPVLHPRRRREAGNPEPSTNHQTKHKTNRSSQKQTKIVSISLSARKAPSPAEIAGTARDEAQFSNQPIGYRQQ